MAEIKEIIQRAECGDVNAMLSLVQYYWQEKNADKAEEWADRAANAGSPDGYSQSIAFKNYNAAIYMQMGDYDGAVGMWRTALRLCEDLLKMDAQGRIKLNQNGFKMISDSSNEAKYGIAQARYCQSKEGRGNWATEIVSLLEDVNTPEASALFAAACMELKNYKAVLAAVNRLISNQEYAQKKKGKLEEEIYTLAFFNLATLYRFGVSGVVSQNMETAVRLLETASNSVRDEDLKNEIWKERSHYKKKLFGGYKYE